MMKYFCVLAAGFVAGGLVTARTVAVAPSWHFSAIAGAVLVAAVGYAAASILSAIRRPGGRRAGEEVVR